MTGEQAEPQRASLKRRGVAAGLLVLGALALCMLQAGCGDAGSAAARSTQPGNDDLLARIQHSGHVRVGVKIDEPPFGSLQGGAHAGFDIDMAYALASRLGIAHVDFVPVTSADRMVQIEHGDVDMVIASMSITRYRLRRVDFTIPYFQDGQALLVRSGSTITSYLDLAGKSVGTVQGSSSSYYMHQVAPNCTVVSVPDFKSLLAALDRGTVAAISSDQTILVGLSRSAKGRDYRVAGGMFTVEPYGIAVPQNQSHWRNALDQALMELWESGQWQAVVDAWFGPGTPYAHRIDFHPPVYPR